MEYTKDTARIEAIEVAKGRDIEVGVIVGHQSDPLTMTVKEIHDDLVTCTHINKGELVFPKNELFSIKKVINIANHLLNVGIWEEGMESTIIHL